MFEHLRLDNIVRGFYVVIWWSTILLGILLLHHRPLFELVPNINPIEWVRTSFLYLASQIVTRIYIHPQNLRYPPRLTNPSSIGTLRKYLFANSGLLNARNTVNDRKYPVFNPIVCAVEAYDKLSTDNKVNAHPTLADIIPDAPSTATSCVAHKNTNKKKMNVINLTFASAYHQLLL